VIAATVVALAFDTVYRKIGTGGSAPRRRTPFEEVENAFLGSSFLTWQEGLSFCRALGMRVADL